MISVPFELEKVEFGILVPGIPLPEKSQKECSLSVHYSCLSLKYAPQSNKHHTNYCENCNKCRGT